MRAVIQRVSRAEVRVDGGIAGRIEKGYVVLLAVSKDDTDRDIEWILEKICHIRVFPNEEGKFDRSLLNTGGEVLLVSQFTLYGDCRKGRRPGFDQAAPPELARELFDRAAERLRAKGVRTETGVFGAMMEVDLVNDGPVTLILDSPNASNR